MAEWGIGKDPSIASSKRCCACLNRGYLHVQGRRHGDAPKEVPCPECVCGKRYIKKHKKGSKQ